MIHPIRPSVMNYAWGKGRDSLIRELGMCAAGTEPVAEAWFGAHVKAPSQLERGDLLSHLGGAALAQTKLPSLAKILSINTALSIQLHPDSASALRLHTADPQRYPEPNHKPEVGIALRPTSILYGLRNFGEINQVLDSEIRELFDLPQSVSSAAGTRQIFGTLFSFSSTEASKKVTQLTDKLNSPAGDSLSRIAESIQGRWALKLAEQFPGDIGIAVALFMNVVELAPLEGIFTAPNVMHAYLSGDIFECMALSDFVIRAGLTPKEKDIKSLLEIVNTEAVTPEILQPTNILNGFGSYKTPAKEFEVLMPSPTENWKFDITPPSNEIWVSVSAKGEISDSSRAHPIKPGSAFFVEENTGSISGHGGGVMFRCRVPNGSL